jgi:hypothetical protein
MPDSFLLPEGRPHRGLAPTATLGLAKKEGARKYFVA